MNVEMVVSVLALLSSIFKNIISALKDLNDMKSLQKKRKRRSPYLKRRRR
ncbi:hypothetical protein [Amphibacillus sediminis]|nr:hypothetical protein [Amphibacillus sediminis]